VRRKRFQEGSLQVRKHGKHKMWVILYREGGGRKYHTLGLYSKLTKSEVQEQRASFMAEINANQALVLDPHITFGAFLDGVALPFLRKKWKRSTAGTTENRITHHLAEFRETKLQAITVKALQTFLDRKAVGLSRSTVSHVRWDLRCVFKLAVAEGCIQRDPTIALYTPRAAQSEPTRAMTGKEVEQYLDALDKRERVIAHLAIFAGLRPGEILGLQRQHVIEDCKVIMIEQRVYRGDIDTPKTRTSRRKTAIPPKTAALLRDWMELVDGGREAWVFVSENPGKPLWRDNVWRRAMEPKLKPIGLDWANFQALRRTHASLGHEAGIDPKVSADQRGHGIGVALDLYTKTDLAKRAEAAERLEKSVFAA
jgi:integrase